MQAARLSALRIGHLYAPGDTPGVCFCWRLCLYCSVFECYFSWSFAPPPLFFFPCVYRYVTRLDVILRFMLSFKIITSNRCDQEFLFTISTSTLHSSIVTLLVKVGTVQTQPYLQIMFEAEHTTFLRIWYIYRIFLGMLWSEKLVKCCIWSLASNGVET